MSWLHRITLIVGLAFVASSSGCCLFSSCAGGKLGMAGPGCGLETYYQGGCSDGGCDGCGDGPVIPCQDGGCKSCLGMGLGCIGKLLGMTGCNGCGETYLHGWVNDPPCCDPCDGQGNWIGPVSGGDCCGSVGCDACGVGVGVEPGCGAAAMIEPSCGSAHVDGIAHGVAAGGCDSRCTKGCFRLPGRAIYATWTGMGGLLRELHRGLSPGYAHDCYLAACNTTCEGQSSACGHCAAGTTYGVASNFGAVSETIVGPGVVTHSGVARAARRLPHDIVASEMRMKHGRPPHPVVANRLQTMTR